jgi:hypothetical protein
MITHTDVEQLYKSVNYDQEKFAKLYEQLVKGQIEVTARGIRATGRRTTMTFEQAWVSLEVLKGYTLKLVNAPEAPLKELRVQYLADRDAIKEQCTPEVWKQVLEKEDQILDMIQRGLLQIERAYKKFKGEQK